MCMIATVAERSVAVEQLILKQRTSLNASSVQVASRIFRPPLKRMLMVLAVLQTHTPTVYKHVLLGWIQEQLHVQSKT
jgi:hypothetical protein